MLDSLIEIYKTEICLASIFFTDAFPNIAKDDNSLKKYQEERRVSFSALI